MTRDTTPVIPDGVSPMWGGRRPRLELGQVLATPGALRYLEQADRLPFEFLALNRPGIRGGSFI